VAAHGQFERADPAGSALRKVTPPVNAAWYQQLKKLSCFDAFS
jgi:hypothetical protein